MSRGSPFWTKEDLSLCREMLLSGATNEQCAERLERTPGAIARKRSSLVHGIVAVQRATAVRLASGGTRDVVMDNRMHLIDLMRAYDGHTLGDAKARYRERNELSIDPGYVNVTHSVTPYHVQRSFVGSQF